MCAAFLHIDKGRHPMLEHQTATFIPNSLALGGHLHPTSSHTSSSSSDEKSNNVSFYSHISLKKVSKCDSDGYCYQSSGESLGEPFLVARGTYAGAHGTEHGWQVDVVAHGVFDCIDGTTGLQGISIYLCPSGA